MNYWHDELGVFIPVQSLLTPTCEHGEKDNDTCEHKEREDCLICSCCGNCREDVDPAELCMDCNGVDHNAVTTAIA